MQLLLAFLKLPPTSSCVCARARSPQQCPVDMDGAALPACHFSERSVMLIFPLLASVFWDLQ